jgi:hypothetical protein
MALETELQTYSRELPNLLGSQGKFALIQGDHIVSIYETYDDALKIGYDRFGIKTPFMIKQIQALENAQFFTRDIAPCHT